MRVSTWGLVVLAVGLNTAAQFMLKAGSVRLTQAGGADAGWVGRLGAGAVDPFVLGGLGLYVGSFVIWLAVLSRLPVSVAYPLLSLGYVAGLFGAWALFGEPLSAGKLAGVGLILAGVVVLARS